MARFWVSWWTSIDPENVPFDNWVSGYRCRPGADDDDDDAWDNASVCALIDADDEDQIWDAIEKLYPDYEERFCEEREADYTPGDRFPGGTGRTSLNG